MDHLMVEDKDPAAVAQRVQDRLGLPLAWPLTEGARYTSIGVNFGDLNIEFIDFRERFGIPGQTFSGFSGVAFTGAQDLVTAREALEGMDLPCRIGERAQAHTTVVVAEEEVFPTVFLVEYAFDTRGWKARLEEEFAACAGGSFGVCRFQAFEFAGALPDAMRRTFALPAGKAHRLVLGTRGESEQVLDDLIGGLEIALVPERC